MWKDILNYRSTNTFIELSWQALQQNELAMKKIGVHSHDLLLYTQSATVIFLNYNNFSTSFHTLQSHTSSH